MSFFLPVQAFVPLENTFSCLKDDMSREVFNPIVESLTHDASKLKEMKITAVVIPVIINSDTDEKENLRKLDLDFSCNLDGAVLTKEAERSYVADKVKAIFQDAIQFSLKTSALFAKGPFHGFKFEITTESVVTQVNQGTNTTITSKVFDCELTEPLAVTLGDLA